MSIYKDFYEQNKDRIAKLEKEYKQVLEINEVNALSYARYRDKYENDIKELTTKLNKLEKEVYNYVQYQISTKNRLSYILYSLKFAILDENADETSKLYLKEASEMIEQML